MAVTKTPRKKSVTASVEEGETHHESQNRPGQEGCAEED